MEELLAQKGKLEKELDSLPRQVRARKTRGANIAGIIIFSIAMMIFSLTLLIIMIVMLDGSISRRELHDVVFAMVLVISMPIVVLGTSLMFSYRPLLNVCYSVSAGVGWFVQLVLHLWLYDLIGSPERYGLAILTVLSFLIFYMITPIVLFALTYPPFSGEDLDREGFLKKQAGLLANYYYVATQMEMLSPMIAREMHDKYAEYSVRRL